MSDKEQIKEAFIAGMETAIKIIGEDLKGGAAQMFSLHCFKAYNLIEELKKSTLSQGG